MEIHNLAADAESFTANAWLVDDQVLVDAGSAPVVLDRLDTVDAVLVTHSHHDHIENLPRIVDRFDPAVYAFAPDNLPVAAVQVEDGATVDAAGYTFDVLHTPGHRDDHVCFYNEDEKVLFAGDLVFPGGGFGRTDLEQGDRDRLIASIDRITDLAVQELYAGHGDAATEDVADQMQESLVEAEQREPKYS